LNVGMALDADGIRVRAEGAEAEREGFLIGERNVLPAEIDHLVAEEGGADLLELFVVQTRKVDAANFRAHGGGQRMRADAAAAVRAVVVVFGRIELHRASL